MDTSAVRLDGWGEKCGGFGTERAVAPGSRGLASGLLCRRARSGSPHADLDVPTELLADEVEDRRARAGDLRGPLLKHPGFGSCSFTSVPFNGRPDGPPGVRSKYPRYFPFPVAAFFFTSFPSGLTPKIWNRCESGSNPCSLQISSRNCLRRWLSNSITFPVATQIR